jgi:hypothetical protein
MADELDDLIKSYPMFTEGKYAKIKNEKRRNKSVWDLIRNINSIFPCEIKGICKCINEALDLFDRVKCFTYNAVKLSIYIKAFNNVISSNYFRCIMFNTGRDISGMCCLGDKPWNYAREIYQRLAKVIGSPCYGSDIDGFPNLSYDLLSPMIKLLSSFEHEKIENILQKISEVSGDEKVSMKVGILLCDTLKNILTTISDILVPFDVYCSYPNEQWYICTVEYEFSNNSISKEFLHKKIDLLYKKITEASEL